MKFSHLLVGMILVGFPSSWSMAQDKVVAVKRGPLKVEYSLSGTVNSDDVKELQFDNQHLTDLKVDQVVEHGQLVSKGQPLLSLKLEDLEKKAQELRQAHRLAELTFEEKKVAARQADELNELARVAKQREMEQTVADFQYWEEVTWPQRLEDLEDGYQRSKEFLEDAQMEFDQLKKMYDEDELVEESEALVLRREERNLVRARKSFARAEESYQRNKEINIPRQEREYRENHRRTVLRLEKELEGLEGGFEKQNIEMEKAEIAYEKSLKDMEQLEKELAAVRLEAPFDGVVYHGPWPVSGKTVKIDKDGKVAAKTTLMTIASVQDPFLTVDLTEEQLAQVKPGTHGYAVPTAFPRDASSVRVRKVNAAPSSNKTFPCELTLHDPPAGLLPGMTCQVKLFAYQNDAALLVPEGAVHTDNGLDYYVYRVKNEPAESKSDTEEGEAKPEGEAKDDSAAEVAKPKPAAKPTYEKANVKLGVRADGKVEVLSGLTEQDKVLVGTPDA